MPPADNTPDFDSMSPEELMAWMETLAERQGASEGFTTDKRMDIAEVDPTAVEDTGPGYIPYGMTEEQWAKKQAEEAAAKAQRAPSAPPPAAPAPPPPPVAAPELEPVAHAPEPQPAAAQAATPDFDSMSPEELMAWMETLAERQGAEIGFTTDKRMQIAEVDPTTVEDTGPGYIPYGMTEEQWAKKQAAEAAAKAQRAAAPPPAAPAPPPPPPVAAPEPEPEPIAAEMPDFSLPQLDTEPEMTTELTTPAPSPEAGGLAWLESLAADQGGDFPQMDLSALGEEIAPLDLDSLAEAVTPVADVTDPMQWLENLAQTPEESFAPSAAAAPSEASDPLEWLESLAKRQGADPEEFTTRADLDIPVPSAQQAATAPGYTDYVFDEDTVGPAIDMPVNVDELDKIDESDPVAWLESLASQQAIETSHMEEAADEDVSEEEIIQDAIQSDVMAALSGGKNVSADAMKDWMDTLLEQGATRSDVIEDVDEDEEIELEAQIPDWLVEQVGPPPEAMMPQASAPAPIEQEEEPLLAEVFAEQPEPDAAPGIPDWLRDEGQDESLSELESIFAAPAAAPPAPPEPEPHTVAAVVTSVGDIEIDPNDPWVEAFELERQQHLQGKDITELLDEIVMDAPSPAAGPVEALQPASFAPESELVPGEAQDVPDWLAEAVPDGGAPAQPAFMSDAVDESVAEGEMPAWLLKQIGMETETELAVVSEMDDDLPEWLKEAGVAKTDTVPDWLIETVETAPEEPVFVAPTPVAPTPAAAPPAPPPPAIIPAAASPAPVHQAALDPAAAAAALDAARTKVSGGDVQGAIAEYEAVVRANTHLDAVIKDLADMIKGAHKHNAAVYRVLGDSLMRHGRLQDALDTYRKALNLL